MSGLNIKKVDSNALALARSVGIASAVILNLDSYGLDVVLILDHVPMSMTHRELQVGLGTEDLVEEIQYELQNFTEYYNGHNPMAPFPQNIPIYLVGSHPQIDSGLVQTLEYSLQRGISSPAPLIEPPPENFPLLQYMVNVGLALKAL